MITNFNNTPIHYKVIGNGPALVLLHGFLLSPSIWTEIIPKLATKNKLIIIDLPGHGKSGIIAEIHTMELMAEVVNHIIEEQTIESANFMGHSMGGYISLAFAEKYPSKIKTLVLLNSSTEADSEERKTNRDRAIKVIEKNKEVFIKMAIAALFPEDKQKENSKLIDTFSKKAIQFPVEGIIAAIKGMKIRKNRNIILENYNGNKFIIAGTKDPIIPFSSIKKIAIETKTKLYKVSSGHMSVNENIDEIINIVHFIDFI